MNDTTRKPFYHNIKGLSDREYEELKDLLLHGGDLWIWTGVTNLRRILRSILYHKECYKKTLAFFELLTIHESNCHMLSEKTFEHLNRMRMKYEAYGMYKLRLKPVRGCGKWSENKACAMKEMDDVAIECILDSFGTDDSDFLARIKANRDRWASKKMPDVRRLKKGPKAKRDRSHEKRPYDTLYVRLARPDGPRKYVFVKRRDLASLEPGYEILRDKRKNRR